MDEQQEQTEAETDQVRDDGGADDETVTDVEVAAEQQNAISEPAEITPVEGATDIFPRLAEDEAGGSGGVNNGDLGMIMDIPVQLTVELGRTKIPIRNILQLAQGSVIKLEALAGDPMDVLVNGCLIAKGEVVVVNDRFGVRLTDIVTPSERINRVQRRGSW